MVFLYTVAIVAGILSPIILVGLIFAGIGLMNTISIKMIEHVEEMKKAPPFDDVELNLNPATRVLTGRIIKNEQVLWQGSVRRQEDDL